MRVAVSSELRRWVMQYGAEAEVLEPRSLRRAVAQELREAVGAYGSVDPDGRR